MDSTPQEKRLLVLVGSPRRNGNSALLAQAVVDGAKEAGSMATLCFIDDYISGLLTDTRHTAPVKDAYEDLLLKHFLPADGLVICTPVYWYAMSAQAKAFFDRSFSYYSSSYPRAAEVRRRMMHKRIGLVLVSEESYPGVALGILHQVQEYARYVRSEFVGSVHGVGNARGEVAYDPRNPLGAAKALGRDMFKRQYSDHRIDTPRATTVWKTPTS